jgi:rhodanese-related sulfurtransferase
MFVSRGSMFEKPVKINFYRLFNFPKVLFTFGKLYVTRNFPKVKELSGSVPLTIIKMLATEFKNRLPDLTILDIRTPCEIEEFDMGGIQIPLDELLLNLKTIENLKNEEIIVICYTGLQSEIACKILQKRGFTKVQNLEGGLEEYLSL